VAADCQETPFPTEIVKVVTIPGEVVDLEAPVGDICLGCDETVASGFSGLGVEGCQKLLVDSETFHTRFFTARNFVTGAVQRTWGEEKASRTSFVMGMFDNIYEGYDLKGFKDMKHVDPADMGLLPVPCTHNVTGESVDVYFAPKDGPLFELRVRSGRGFEWGANQMPVQIYSEQGSDLQEYCRTSHVMPDKHESSLLSPMQFRQRLESAKARKPGGARRCPSLSQMPPPASQAAPPVSWGPCARPAVSTAGAPATPLLESSSSVARPFIPKFQGNSATVAPPLRPMPSAESLKRIANFRRPVIPEAPTLAAGLGLAWSKTSTPEKRAMVNCAGGTGADAGPPAAKSLRGPSSVAGYNFTSSAVASVPAGQRGGFATRPMSLGRSPSSAGADLDGRSDATGFSRRSSHFQSPCKYQRAIDSAPLSKCFQGANMATHFTNVKKMCTTAKNAGEAEAQAKLQDHLDQMDAACALVWSRMLTAKWEINKSNCNILTKAPGSSLPKDVIALLAARCALEHMPPHSTPARLDAFWQHIDLNVASDQRIAFSIEDARLSATVFTESDLQFICPVAMELAIFDGVAIPLMRKGEAGVTELVAFMQKVIDTLTKYPDPLRTSPVVSRVLTKARAISFLKGRHPFENQSTISDVEYVSELQEDSLGKEFKVNDYWKGTMAGAWSFSNTEKTHWPAAQMMLTKLQACGPDGPFDALQECVENYSRWSHGHQLRSTVLDELRALCVAKMLEAMSKADFSNPDESCERVEKVKSLVTVVKRGNTLWSDPELTRCLDKATDFSRVMTEKDICLQIIDVCDAIGKESTMETLFEKINELHRNLPHNAQKVKIRILSEESAQKVLQGLEKTLCAACQRYPLGATQNEVVQLALKCLFFDESLSESCKEKRNNVMNSSNMVGSLLALKESLTQYSALGEHSAARESNDTKSAKMRVLIKCHDEPVLNDAIPENIVNWLGKEFPGLDALKDEAKHAITDHGMLKINRAKATLDSHAAKLHPVYRGGGADGISWKQHLKPDCTYEDFAAASKPLVDQTNPNQLLEYLQKTREAG